MMRRRTVIWVGSAALALLAAGGLAAWTLMPGGTGSIRLMPLR